MGLPVASNRFVSPSSREALDSLAKENHDAQPHNPSGPSREIEVAISVSASHPMAPNTPWWSKSRHVVRRRRADIIALAASLVVIAISVLVLGRLDRSPRLSNPSSERSMDCRMV